MALTRFPQLLLALIVLALASCGESGGLADFGAEPSAEIAVVTESVAPPPPQEDGLLATVDTSTTETAPATPSSLQVSEPDDTTPVVAETPVEAPVEIVQPVIAQNTAPEVPPGQLIDPESWNYEEVHTKTGYELVFSDEFNSREVNPDRWNTQLRWDGEFNGLWYEYRIINNEKQFYVNTLTRDGEHRDKLLQPNGYNPFRFDGAQLSIRATANQFLNSREPTQLDEAGRDISFGRFEPLLKRQPFLSGALASYDKFSQKYGYFEARIRLPAHTGTFPAFWLHHQRQNSEDTQRSEIDIMENLGHAPGVVYNTFHYFDYVTVDNPGQGNLLKPEPSGGRVTVGGDFSSNYHVYAVDWRPGSIVWYIDDQPVGWLSNEQVDFEEMYVIMNLAIGGEWINFPEFAGGLGRGETDFYPTIDEQDPMVFGNPEMEIDYVRVYRRIE